MHFSPLLCDNSYNNKDKKLCFHIFCIADKIVFALVLFQTDIKLAEYGMYYMTDWGADVNFPIG